MSQETPKQKLAAVVAIILIAAFFDNNKSQKNSSGSGGASGGDGESKSTFGYTPQPLPPEGIRFNTQSQSPLIRISPETKEVVLLKDAVIHPGENDSVQTEVYVYRDGQRINSFNLHTVKARGGTGPKTDEPVTCNDWPVTQQMVTIRLELRPLGAHQTSQTVKPAPVEGKYESRSLEWMPFDQRPHFDEALAYTRKIKWRFTAGLSVVVVALLITRIWIFGFTSEKLSWHRFEVRYPNRCDLKRWGRKDGGLIALHVLVLIVGVALVWSTWAGHWPVVFGRAVTHGSSGILESTTAQSRYLAVGAFALIGLLMGGGITLLWTRIYHASQDKASLRSYRWTAWVMIALSLLAVGANTSFSVYTLSRRTDQIVESIQDQKAKRSHEVIFHELPGAKSPPSVTKLANTPIKNVAPVTPATVLQTTKSQSLPDPSMLTANRPLIQVTTPSSSKPVLNINSPSQTAPTEATKLRFKLEEPVPKALPVNDDLMSDTSIPKAIPVTDEELADAKSQIPPVLPEGAFYGVGFVVEEATAPQRLPKIVSVVPGSSAHLSGIISDHHLTAIDGEDARKLTLGQIVKKLKDTSPTLVILRTAHDGREWEHPVTRCLLTPRGKEMDVKSTVPQMSGYVALPRELPCQLTARQGTLDLHAQPGSNTPVLGTLKSDTRNVFVIGGAAENEHRMRWRPIRSGQLRGWVPEASLLPFE